eukprot:1662595-Rhodomonas_salina.1
MCVCGWTCGRAQAARDGSLEGVEALARSPPRSLLPPSLLAPPCASWLGTGGRRGEACSVRRRSV